MPRETLPVHVNIDSALRKKIDHLCTDHELFRSEVVEILLEKAISSLNTTVDWYIEVLIADFNTKKGPWIQRRRTKGER